MTTFQEQEKSVTAISLAGSKDMFLACGVDKQTKVRVIEK